MYSHIFSSIPILENDNIILRLPERNDILEIHTLLNEKDIFLNYAEENQDYKDIDKIENIFIIQPHYYFQKKELVTFVIVDKKTKKVIGLREIHFDAGDSHVTIQGFIGLNHSLKGISKEAYYLIIDFLIKNNVKGIKANTFFENFAAVSLLNSIGFKTIKVYNLNEKFKILFELNLENFQKRNRIFDDVYLKKAIVFFESYLAGSDFKVTKLEENNLFQIDFYSKFIYVNLFSLNIDKKVSIILNGNKFKIKNDKYHSKLDGSVSYNIPFGYVIGLTNLISLGSY